jgi:hypothetical protein
MEKIKHIALTALIDFCAIVLVVIAVLLLATATAQRAHAQDFSGQWPFTIKAKPSTTASASINIPPGTAPTSANNGDLYTTITGLWARINGTTVPIVSGPASSTAGDIATFGGTNGQTVSDSGFSIATMFQQASTGCWETLCFDSVHGSDSNPCTAALPCQTFAPSVINYGAALTNGQSAGLACGSDWKSTLTSTNQSVLGISTGGTATPTSYVTIAAYNYGGSCSALPILDGSAQIPNSAFTAVGGSYPNLYYAGASFTASGSGTALTVSSVTGVIEPGYTIAGNACIPSGTKIVSGSGTSWVSSAATTFSSQSGITASPTFLSTANSSLYVWETGAAGDDPTGQYMSLQTSEANANANAGGYYIPGCTTFQCTVPAAAFIYVHPYDGSDAITNGFTYEYSMQIPLTISPAYAKVSGIEARKTGSNTGMFNFLSEAGSYQLSNCIARDGGRHSALLSSGSIVNNCEFLNGYDNEATIGTNMLVFHDASAIGSLPITVNNSIFQMNQVVSGNAEATSIISHTDDSSSMGTAYLNNDWYISKNGVSLAGFGFSNVHAVIANQQYGSQIASLDAPAQNVTVTNSQVVSYTGTPIFQFRTAGITLSVDNTKLCGEATGQGLFRVISVNNLNISVTNSQIYIRYPSPTYAMILYLGDTGTTVNFSNDDFGANLAWLPIEDFGSTNTLAATSTAAMADRIFTKALAERRSGTSTARIIRRLLRGRRPFRPQTQMPHRRAATPLRPASFQT